MRSTSIVLAITLLLSALVPSSSNGGYCYVNPPFFCGKMCPMINNWCVQDAEPTHYCQANGTTCVDANNPYCCPYQQPIF